jgi:hypothetical protein
MLAMHLQQRTTTVAIAPSGAERALLHRLP